MSTVLDRPIETTRLQPAHVPVALRPKIRVEPQHQPVIHLPVGVPAEIPQRVTKRVAKKRSSVRAAEYILAKGILFGAFFSVAFVASTLSGHYMVEKSRNQGIAAASRSAIAIQSEREVQRHLDVLTSARSIEDWALSHAFRPTDGLGQTSRVVNLVATTR